ncbi:MAG: CoA transferase, partial [Streptosporangiales bacterium]|nr:CoA transferase [Streptosporangiales bacterium]
MESSASPGPLHGIRVVEASPGITAAGAGLATSLPGSILRDLGAEVTVVRPGRSPALDRGIEFRRAWDRGKRVVDGDADTVRDLADGADILFLAGAEERVERAGLAYPDLAAARPRLIVARIRPSVTGRGPVDDYELLVAARAGLMSQIRAHRPGPAASDLAIGQAGAGLSAAAGALALLYAREATGTGGWAETSLHDGMAALLPMIIGSVERHSPTTRLLWQNQGPSEALSYRCADGEWVQLWFGAKGAFEAFLEHVGDPPSTDGYNAELAGDGMKIRGERWSAMFAAKDRDWWLKDLAGQKFRCEPVLRPGEALRDPQARHLGLAVDDGDRTFLGPAVTVTPAGPRTDTPRPGGNLLDGIRVLDLSAYLAGPVTPLILGEFGADVVKVEPPAGDVHRKMEPMFAAGQRGKRAVALDLKSPEAPAELAKMFRWADVVHHNSRLGLDSRLGYDEPAVRRANPGAVYSFASGFGESGPRAALPANDQLMQAIAGIEAGQGGAGQAPTYLVWGAVDVTGGWIAACGILAGLYARRMTGAGQKVASSLLGAALTLKSGAFLSGGQVVPGPVLDGNQTGYGAAYRIYQCRDGAWIALAVPGDRAWGKLREVTGAPGLPEAVPPLRT